MLLRSCILVIGAIMKGVISRIAILVSIISSSNVVLAQELEVTSTSETVSFIQGMYENEGNCEINCV